MSVERLIRKQDTRCRWFLIAMAWFLTVLTFGTATTHAQQLSANIKNAYSRGRSDAPLVLRVDLDYTGKMFRQGKLELELEYLDVLGTVTTQAIALTGGRKSINITVPGLTISSSDFPLSVQLRFLEKDAEPIALGDFFVNVPDQQSHSQVLAVCDPWTETSGRQQPALVRSLSLEAFQPRPKRKPNSLDVNVRTYPASLLPRQMPRHAMGYLPFDLTLLMADGFAQMEAEQLAALTDWIRAGGSACIMIGKDLEEKHLTFLNDLIKVDGGIFEWTPDRDILYSPMQKGTSLVKARADFGRVVVLFETSDRDTFIASPAWRDARFFLWRIVESQRMNIAKDGSWTASAPINPDNDRENELWNAPTRNGGNGDFDYVQQQDYLNEFDNTPSELIATMMPKSVRLIPFELILVLLGAFCLVIGPGDYFILGWLKRRKLTWITFPVVAVAFTWLTVSIADHFMGQNTSSGDIVIRDVGSDGHLLRETRFSLNFPHRNVTHNIAFKNAWHEILEAQSSRLWAVDNYEPTSNPPSFEGRIPANYSFKQLQRKWSPLLTRTTSLHHAGEDQPALALNWKDLDTLRWSDIQEAAKNQSKTPVRLLTDTLAGDNGTLDGRLAVITADEELGAPDFGDVFDRSDGYELYSSRRAIRSEAGRAWSYVPDFVVAMCRSNPHHLFSVISQVSPTGGKRIRDLSVIDSSSKEAWVLLLLRQEDGDSVIYRRLFAKQP